MPRPALLVSLLLLAFAVATASADSLTFTHYAGSNGGPGTADGIGGLARFRQVGGIAVQADGSLIVSDTWSSTLRRVATTGFVSTFAGIAAEDAVVEGGRGVARVGTPVGIAIDAAGNLYVANYWHVILRVTPGGVVTVWAGRAGTPGSNDGSRLDARFRQPGDLAFDSDGNLFVVDYGNHTVRKITPAGIVSTFAGTAGTPGVVDGIGTAASFNYPSALAIDAADNIYVADSSNHTIRKITPAAAVTTIAGAAGSPGMVNGPGPLARFNSPLGIEVVGSVVYVGDANNNLIRKITQTGDTFSVTTWAGTGACGWRDGDRVEARFCSPAALAAATGGTLYVGDRYTNTIRTISAAGVVSTLAGKASPTAYVDGIGVVARFAWPYDVAIDGFGAVFVADRLNHVIRKISDPDASVSLFAGAAGTSGTADGTGADARFYFPEGVAVDAANNVYVADRNNHTIRKITPFRAVTTFAGTAGMPGSSDGTGAAARFTYPSDVASDGTNVYVAEPFNHTIRKITSTRVVTTLAGHAGESGSADGTALARFNGPTGVAADSAGNVYVADTGNHTIRKITSAGLVSTVAGLAGSCGSEDGIGADARFCAPKGIAVEERAGSIYLYVSSDETIRMIAPGAVVTTIGGSADEPRASIAGTGAVSRFYGPRGLDFRDGRLFIADADSNCIRLGTPALATVATIDDDTGAVGAVRQLAATPAATSYSWRTLRRPSGSEATLSSSIAASPTFTPDIPDVYRFGLIAEGTGATSITEVELTALCPSISISPATLPSSQVAVPYSQTLTASGGVAPRTFSLAWGALPAGLTLSTAGTISGTPTTAGAVPFGVRVTDYYGCTGQRDYTLDVRAIQPPTGLVATATSATSVALSWNASTGAAGYRVHRGNTLASLSLLADVAGTTHTDLTAVANHAYVYQVFAYDSADNVSDGSVKDFATTVVFTDASLAGTVVKTVHITQLRTAVNALRALAGLSPYVWLDPALAAGLKVRSPHVTDLRVAVIPARQAFGLATPFTDPELTGGYLIRAVHLTELRDSVK